MSVPKKLNHITDPETGKVYPIPAGGSDDGDVGEVEEVEESEEDEEEDYSSDDDDDYAGNFLEGIEDEEVRQQLEPYVKKWDAGVTRRFQELHSQYQPYKELGDIEQIQQAQELYRLLDENPQQVYQALSEALGTGQQGQPGQQTGNQTPAQSAGMSEGQYAQLPPQVQQQIEQQQRILETLAQSYISDQEQKKIQEEDAALDSYLDNLKQEFGDFDEDYVLSKMLNGMDGAKAVKSWRKTLEKYSPKSAPREQPTVLSGGGSVPSENYNVGEMNSNDVKSLVAGFIAQANQEGN